MRKLIYMISALPLLLTGCSDDETIEINDVVAPGLTVTSASPYFNPGDEPLKGAVGIRSGGDPISFTVETNQDDWTLLLPTTDWLSVSETADGFEVSATRNFSEELRATEIKVKAGPGYAPVYYTLDVTQRGAGMPEITVSSADVFISGSGRPKEVVVTTNQDEWGFDVSSAWLLVSQSGDKLIMSADPNDRLTTRSTRVTVTAGFGRNMDEVSVAVTQGASSNIILRREAKNFASGGGEFEFGVLAGDPNWSVGDHGYDWITATKESDDAIKIVVGEYEGFTFRKAEIPVLSGDVDDNPKTEIFTVVQAGLNDMVIEVQASVVRDAMLPIYDDEGRAEISCYVYWDDGSMDYVIRNYPAHTYQASGDYNVIITGDMPSLNSYAMSDKKPLEFITAIRQWGNTGLVSMRYALTGCINLTYLPDDTQGAFGDVERFGSAFEKIAIEEIPAGLLSNASKATELQYLFNGCAQLKSIPAGLFDKTLDATDFSYTFFGTKALTSVPEGLFDKCVKATEFGHTFEESGITSVPENLFAKCPEVTSFYGTFAKSKISAVPARIFANNPEVTTFNTVFSGCAELQSVPADLFASNTKAEKFFMAFNSSGLTSIPATLFSRNTQVKDFNYLFSSCPGITSIPAGMFDNNTLVEDFGNAFNATGITSIPSGLFDKATAVTTFENAFRSCTKLQSIPAGLFDYATAAQKFNNIFESCTSLTSIPAELFRKCNSATTFNYAFYRCTNLAATPSKLLPTAAAATASSLFNGCTGLTTAAADTFEGCAAITSFSNAFSGCSALASLDAGLFAGCVANTSFASTFDGTAITAIPSGLFDDNVNVTSFNATFRNCASLTTVPAGLFTNNKAVTTVYACFRGSGLTGVGAGVFSDMPVLTDAGYAFYDCKELVAIPGDLFAGSTGITTFYCTFENCTKLAAIPTGLFDDNKKVTNFSYTFAKCTSLTGMSPHTVVDSNNVRLWERDTANGFTKPTTTSRCFQNCSGLGDFSQVPSAWQ